MSPHTERVFRTAERFVAFIFGLGLAGILVWLAYLIYILWGRL